MQRRADPGPALRRRRGLFRIWIAASIALSIYVGIAAPLVRYVGAGYDEVALFVPAIMVLLLASGLGWLVLLTAPVKPSGDSRPAAEKRPSRP